MQLYYQIAPRIVAAINARTDGRAFTVESISIGLSYVSHLSSVATMRLHAALPVDGGNPGRGIFSAD